jgi:hypothetical protein
MEDNNETLDKCTHPGCNKTFKSNWSMARHVRTHTGEKVKKFECFLNVLYLNNYA